MKLNIGENIRNYRRNADMTQEQLAELLGVSYQSVSRWENGTTYPDLELIPTLAQVFSVTIDDLMNNGNEEQRLKHIDELQNSFDEAAKQKDVSRMCSLIKDIQGELRFVTANVTMVFCAAVNREVGNYPEVLQCLRDLFAHVMRSESEYNDETVIIRYMAQIEDDEHIDDFIKHNSTSIDISKNELLRWRYIYRNQGDKLEPIRLKRLYLAIDNMLTGMGLWRNEALPKDVNYSKWVNRVLLQFLHLFNQASPDEECFISGGGEVDIFVESRLLLGFRKACYEASTGDANGAFVTLDDTITLLEKAMALKDGDVLKSSSPALNGYERKVEFVWDTYGDGKIRREMISFDDDWFFTVNPYNCLNILVNRKGWEWFDPIRNDPRYYACIKRIEKLVVCKE
ncbi:MAG: helix-turn-helix transcriptional regulator [Clostridia bacterium]|nr:helix-turn-helix transcriptional regulator [Clostridia bacterium]